MCFLLFLNSALGYFEIIQKSNTFFQLEYLIWMKELKVVLIVISTLNENMYFEESFKAVNIQE